MAYKYKMVNGEQVELTPAEILELEARDATYEPERQEYYDRVYQQHRAGAYPSIGDQLDAILKQLNYMQMNGQTNLVTELDGIVEQWLAVKRDYPKPE